jgi:4-oxalomesaconate tautomerase
MTATAGVRCAFMRGGSSKGALLLAADLPAGRAERDELLLRIMGSPDPRQVDGLGGAHPLTSKVGVVSPSTEPDVHVDYLFLQVKVDEPVVSSSQTCGNILAAVGPFAIERGLVAAGDATTDVRVRMVNTGGLATLRVRTPGGIVSYAGTAELSGVPGTAAPVEIVLEPSGSPLLPTGRVRDRLDGVEATCVDNGMPSVIVKAADLGCTGRETPEELEADPRLAERVRRIRAAAVHAMGLDPDLEASTVPKIVLVSSPSGAGVINTRCFIPVRVHQAIGVLAAASVAAAAALPGTVAHELAEPGSEDEPVRIEHPTGFLDVGVLRAREAEPGITRTVVVRTARMILDGTVYPGPARRV